MTKVDIAVTTSVVFLVLGFLVGFVIGRSSAPERDPDVVQHELEKVDRSQSIPEDKRWWWDEPRLSTKEVCQILDHFQTIEEFQDWLGPRYMGNPSLTQVLACAYFRKENQ